MTLLVHHIGKESGKGQRGASAMLDNSDVQLMVENPNGTSPTMKATKVKSGTALGSVPFTIKTVQLGPDSKSAVATWDLEMLDGVQQAPPAPLTHDQVYAAVAHVVDGDSGAVARTAAIAAHLGVAPNDGTFKGRLSDLLSDGRLLKPVRGSYSLGSLKGNEGQLPNE